MAPGPDSTRGVGSQEPARRWAVAVRGSRHRRVGAARRAAARGRPIFLGLHHRAQARQAARQPPPLPFRRTQPLGITLSLSLPSWSRLTLPWSAGGRQPGASRAVGNVDCGAASLQQVDTSELSRVHPTHIHSPIPCYKLVCVPSSQGTVSDCVLGSLFAHVLLSPLSYYLSGLNDGMVVANQGVPREAEQVR